MLMKKLFLVSSALLLATAAKADAQVYEMTLTLKSTLAKSGGTSSVVCSEPENDTKLYRKQSTIRVKGLIWGCDCVTISDPQPVTDPASTFGYVFWNATTGKVMEGEFGWKLLNRIDKRLKKAEGTWVFEGGDFSLVGGGFGTIKDVVDKECCSIESTILTPMNGNVAGYFTMPAQVISKGTDAICEKCQVIAGTDDVVAIAPGFSLCECADESELTTATGTWRLKFDTTAANKWNKSAATEPITSVYAFPSYVVNYLNSL